MNLQLFVFGVYPYIAGSVFLVGSVLRFDRDPYSWKSYSSQLLADSGLRVGSNLFHIGILALFLGHFVGLLTPHVIFHALGVNDLVHQYVAIAAGATFGTLCLIGGVMLWLRRVLNQRVRSAGRTMDLFILTWLLVTLSLGLSTIPVSIEHARANEPAVMLALAEWVRSIATFQPDPALLTGVDPIFKVHLFFGMTVFLLFPFTRLVHIWSVPFGYLFRAYQIVRRKNVSGI